ncbi:MAG: cytochrome c biogenesis protein ResB [Acidobacteria bacterium]|uniref:Cytochrome c biogenesis protein ResB n=1 Tax=Candidatus Polarisedimenticola svalbardensis TaxID=2886004 RepID=A0A8J6XSP7_9BACT|nr:cytochrome c biogenesis protein ResB [Candidatus Polarisedimenticola svalbardensis]
MLDKTLFAVRRFRQDIWLWLGSWKLSIVLIVLAVLYYLLLAIWAASSPPHVVRNIASLMPFWLLYLLLLVNTGTCLWRRLAILKHDLSPRSAFCDRPPEWTVPVGPEMVEIDLKRAGYKARQDGPDTGLTGSRGRWSALGTYLFHGSFFLIATAFLLTLAGRNETTFQVAEGEIFRSGPEFVVRRITPEFWQDQLLFTQLEADLGWEDGSRSITRINKPVMTGPASFLRLSGFGYVPRYELLDKQGQILDSAWVKMNLFPPGLRDWFQVEGYPHRFYLTVIPDPEEQDGRLVTRSLNLNEPVIDLEVYRGHLSLGTASLSANQGFDFEGLTIRIAEIRYWGEFTLVRDPGVLPLFAGFALGLIGLMLRLPGKRSEVVFRLAVEGEPARILGWGEMPAGLEEDL